MPNLTIPTRARVRKDVRDVLNRTEWPSVEACIDSIDRAMAPHKMFVCVDGVDFSGESGYETLLIGARKGNRYLCDACSGKGIYFDNVLGFSWQNWGKSVDAYIT